MHFCHLPEIWRDFPNLAAGALVLDAPAQVMQEPMNLDQWYDRARQRLADSRESEMPEIDAWRRVFSKMGLKPTNYRCAAEALLRRFRQDDQLPRFHPVVDLCNAISLAFAIPIAVFDLAQVDSFLEVCYAAGQENYLAFNGETERPEPGEVVFRDGSGSAHSRRWTFRQSKRSVVSAQTTRMLIVAEAVHNTARENVQAIVGALEGTLTRTWTAPSHQAILAAPSPRIDF